VPPCQQIPPLSHKLLACPVLERLESTGSKSMFSLSSVILFKMIGVDSCVLLVFTTRVGLDTRLNGLKSILFEQSRVEFQFHELGHSARFQPLPYSPFRRAPILQTAFSGPICLLQWT